MADKNYGLLISALVAMVAIVGLVVLLHGDSSGAVTVIRGDAASPFERSLGSKGAGLLGAREICFYDQEGNMVCPQLETPSQRTFGPPKEYREGGEPTQLNTASERGYFGS